MIKRTKRYFQLLEVMIAMFLIATCAIPVISSYASMYQAQKAAERSIELDHLSALLHAQVSEFLYQLGAKGGSILDLMDKPIPIDVDSSLTQHYDFFYHLHTINHKPFKETDLEGEKMLVELKIQAVNKYPKTDHDKERVYAYKVCIKREFAMGQDEMEQQKDNATATKVSTQSPKNKARRAAPKPKASRD
jgi:hypothetical protein